MYYLVHTFFASNQVWNTKLMTWTVQFFQLNGVLATVAIEWKMHLILLSLWQYGLWSFQTGGTKLERFLPKNQHTQRKLLNFENWISGELSKIELHFRFIISFIQPSRVGSLPLTQFLKFNNFLWVCWFLGKNLSNFVPPAWKLHHPYYHTPYSLALSAVQYSSED